MPLPLTYSLDERTSGRIVGTITEEDGVTPIPSGTLTTLTFTLYADDGANTIINARSAVDILNANGGTVTSGGVLTLTLAPADNQILNAALPFERHIVLLAWTWGSGKAGNAELVLSIRNLQLVP
jgi:hypothetical protein